jgi:hypothetical protein
VEHRRLPGDRCDLDALIRTRVRSVFVDLLYERGRRVAFRRRALSPLAPCAIALKEEDVALRSLRRNEL